MAQDRNNPRYPQQPSTPPQPDGLDMLGLAQPQIMTRQHLMQSQAQYKGNQHSDLVEVTIVKDGRYLKEGQVLRVHPTAAYILQQQGLIEGTGRAVERARFENKDITVDA